MLTKSKVSDPTVHGETEWISVSLHGQSFMLHQVLCYFDRFERVLNCLIDRKYEELRLVNNNIDGYFHSVR